MITDIFLRTYHKDIPWLAHALASIHKYVKGHRRIIITIPEGQGYLLGHLTAETVIEVPDMADGYIGQQLTKMEAWQHTDADAIVFWDSDVVATEPIDINQEYFFEGKPILYKTRYSSINSHIVPGGGVGCPWQPITAKAIGFVPEFEYMRRMPIVHLRNVLGDCCGWIERQQGVNLRGYLERQPLKHFSEFNAIGAFAERFYADQYAILDTEMVNMPLNKVTQFWSWGGITPEVQQQINNALG